MNTRTWLALSLLFLTCCGAEETPSRAGGPSALQRADAERLGIPVSFQHPCGLEFVLIPSGTFQSDRSRASTWLAPVAVLGAPGDVVRREVKVRNSFYLSTTELTNGHVRKIKPGWKAKAYKDVDFDGDDLPVVRLTWPDARHFCVLMSKADPAHSYRLPLEAEWELAARAGGAGESSGGTANLADQSAKREWPVQLQEKFGANKDRSFNKADDGHAFLSPVRSFSPNAYGLYDMLGNTSEWVLQYHNRGAYGMKIWRGARWVAGEPVVIKGGSWATPSNYSSTAHYALFMPGRWSVFIGIRVLATIKPPRKSN